MLRTFSKRSLTLSTQTVFQLFRGLDDRLEGQLPIQPFVVRRDLETGSAIGSLAAISGGVAITLGQPIPAPTPIGRVNHGDKYRKPCACYCCLAFRLPPLCRALVGRALVGRLARSLAPSISGTRFVARISVNRRFTSSTSGSVESVTST